MVKIRDKTKKQPIKELAQLRRRIAELEASGRKRNQFEEALRTERDKAQQYLDVAEVILVALNKKGEITLINRKGNQILGYKEGELLGKNWFTTCVPSPRRKKVKSRFLELMAGAIKLTEFYENPALTQAGTERIIAWHNTLLKDEYDAPIGTLSSGMDITERKQAEQRYQTILRIAMDGFGLVDMQGHYQDVNEAYCRIIGYSRNELLNMTIPDIEVIESSEDTAKHIRKIEKIGYDRFETRQRRKDGKIIDVEVSVTYLPTDGGRMVAFYRDITERKQAEEALRESETTLRALITAPTDSVLLLDSQGIILDLNKIAAKRLGKKRDELIGTLADSSLPEDVAKRRRSIISQILKTGREVRFEDERDGIWFDTVAHPITDKDGAVGRIAIIARDITERKRADEELRQSEERYRLLFEEARDGIALADADTGILLDCNQALADLVGRNRAELIGQHQAILHPPSGNNTGISATFKKHLTNKEGQVLETQVLTVTGEIREVEIKANLLYLHGRKMLQGIFRDITEHKRAEKEIAWLANFPMLNPMPIVEVDQNGQLTYTNPATQRLLPDLKKKQLEHPFLADTKPYFVNLRKKEKIFSVREVEVSGKWYSQVITLSDPEHIRIYAADISDRKEAEESLRESEEKYRDLVENINDILYATDEHGIITYIAPAIESLSGYTISEIIGHSFFEFVYEDDISSMKDKFQQDMSGRAEPHEYRMMTKAGDIRWVRTSSRSFFEGGRVVGLRGVFTDITERKQAEEEIKRGYEQLQEILHSTVKALASTVEMKDQYTAGHQPRVTQLACAIAEEMGLSEDQIEGIRMAASIHDIGKIMVPAEILNKPGKLTEIQYEMIKMHPRAGYDILKGLKLPWPVAQIILQHHERQDGSGYPQGLSGEEIMVEARILAVANVVEAMNAHRPYRPAYDIKEALAEISKNRGALYDATVVDACLRLFTEKGFTLAPVSR
jgi:PAS domain S-box-containing protein